MSDMTSYVDHCYDLLLKTQPTEQAREDEELCACGKLLMREENN